MRIGDYKVSGYYVGNVLDRIRCLPDESVQSIVTSPPYWRKGCYDGKQLAVWGGRSTCAHSWKWTSRWSSNGGKHGKNAKVGATKKEQQRVRVKEARCKKCGAWRGQIGMEYIVEDYIEHCALITAELLRVMRPDGVMFWNIGDSYDPKWTKTIVGVPSMMLSRLKEQGWLIRNNIAWVKRNASPASANDRFSNAHESILICVKGKKYKFNKRCAKDPYYRKYENQDAWLIPTLGWKNRFDYCESFPPALPYRCIVHGSDPGDLILDPFAGSGTTLALAELMGRKFLGFDISANYESKVYPERLEFVKEWFVKHEEEREVEAEKRRAEEKGKRKYKRAKNGKKKKKKARRKKKPKRKGLSDTSR